VSDGFASLPVAHRRGRAFAWRVFHFLLPLLTVAALLLLWQGSKAIFGIPVYMLPRPSDFLGEFVKSGALIWKNAIPTAAMIIGGFIIGTVIAVPLGLLIASNRNLERGVYPAIVVLQVAPKTIITPLLIVWLGIGLAPQLALTTVMTFFPILVDSIAGFKATDPRLFYIAKTMGASPYDTFRHVRLPAAMPQIFSGLKIGMLSAVTGSVVVEYVGSNAGLGYLTLWASSRDNMPLMFCAIIATAFLGFFLNAILLSCERLLMPWMRREGEE
jgi:NitT/TauT family transport system permease protein